MSLSTSNIFAALDTKKKKKSGKSSKESGDKKKKETSEPDRYCCQIKCGISSAMSGQPTDIYDFEVWKVFHLIKGFIDVQYNMLQGPDLAAAALFWPGQACSNQLGGH